MTNPIVTALVEQGYVELTPEQHRVDPSLMVQANRINHRLINSLSRFGEAAAVWRSGEHEADLFLMQRTGSSGTDQKAFLHIAHDLDDHLPPFITSSLTQIEIDDLKRLRFFFFELHRCVGAVVRGVTQRYPALFPSDIIDRYHAAAMVSQPYATSCLRGLAYPAQANQGGAKAHFDRDFITAHCGDEGGQLFGHTSLTGGVPLPLSPKPGNILLFWGIKAMLLSEGAVMPLRHSATAVPNVERRALVFFGQVDSPEPVANAQQTWEQYWQSRGVDNPSVPYERWFQS